ncbi:MAG: response regulator [Bacteroidia bacterium]
MTKTNKVLLIDDDEMLNMINKRIMQKANYAENPQTYLNATDAIDDIKETVQTHPGDLPDAIFLDINMPNMDGWEFLEEFEKIPGQLVNKCKVFMLTSSIDPRDIEKSKSYKTVSEFICKPLSVEKLKILNMLSGTGTSK